MRSPLLAVAGRRRYLWRSNLIGVDSKEGTSSGPFPFPFTVRTQILKQLLQAHSARDDESFRKAALQLAASESTAGHIRIANELREIISQMPVVRRTVESATPIDIAQPRGEVGSLLVGGFRSERLGDIVLPGRTHDQIVRILSENRRRAEIERWGVGPKRKLLFYGPPGCGKTLTACVLAGELGMPLMTVRFDGLFSRYLGATASHLKTIFDELPRRPAVYLFDEFDAVGKFRGDSQEVGEIRRVVTSFLQLMDADRSPSLIIAATNYEELLDRAVFRRFDKLIHFRLPIKSNLEQLIPLRLRVFGLPKALVKRLAAAAIGLSYADAGRACDDALRSMVLDHREIPSEEDLVGAFEEAKVRLELKPAAAE